MILVRIFSFRIWVGGGVRAHCQRLTGKIGKGSSHVGACGWRSRRLPGRRQLGARHATRFRQATLQMAPERVPAKAPVRDRDLGRAPTLQVCALLGFWVPLTSCVQAYTCAYVSGYVCSYLSFFSIFEICLAIFTQALKGPGCNSEGMRCVLI